MYAQIDEGGLPTTAELCRRLGISEARYRRLDASGGSSRGPDSAAPPGSYGARRCRDIALRSCARSPPGFAALAAGARVFAARRPSWFARRAGSTVTKADLDNWFVMMASASASNPAFSKRA